MAAFSKIVIAGGGIIGNSVAYYLAKQNGVPVTLIDPVGIAPAASGSAGGLLAKDWRDGTTQEQLHRRGFALHEELAKELDGGTTDYRRLNCAAVYVKGYEEHSNRNNDKNESPSLRRKYPGVEWADKNVLGMEPMGDESTIAQVHPKKLCEAMWNYSESAVGSVLKKGRVVEAIVKDDSVQGVKLEDGEIVDADALVVACGPWTDEARHWFSKHKGSLPEHHDGDDGNAILPRVFGLKCHSYLVKPKSGKVYSQGVFFQGFGDEVEVYPRPDGDVYVNGCTDDDIIVTERPGSVTITEDKLEKLRDAMRYCSSDLGGEDLHPHLCQSCYMPVADTDESIIIGPIPGVKGAFVGAGHGPWGILQGPSTGEAIAELLMGKDPTHVDLSPYAL
uniref:FAD dependent oxidoreductase domain-containing protein n=1 Tax=Helicotheca tamesis TaxID=374047 RepID=A0A7S2E0X3_9STRA|mmetsp:Transcript_11418/g.15823  ORF Transcript_11418/g.15823 Transcript_11418/m.15823 type:complete len:391 (+) Transcript_11418:162-1334(+)|eukprot:CAMPEP_0185741096 /NCGR_PEP_ID=MMETSP1171-20130828/38772_1 /TAXON_ID=374046 /ORGANISM="Helicotheca tamensis, Strain CCMP826" /LENGTH=390 /DNA_ID=CAMNT_0028413039 /DNA_START=76 /DNA_END=1248 /DNA_ORIENTATION=+